MAGSANPGGGGSGSSSNANPSELSSAALIMAERTNMLRAVYGGTQTMRAKEKDFLPQYEKESDSRYQARLASTFSLNKLREAVEAASAKPFRTLVKVSNSDPDLDLWIKDIDLTGTHLHVFGHKLFNSALLDGQSHFLVDHPDTSDMPNLAVQKSSGARPFFKLIQDQQLIAAYSEYVGGDTQVTHCRIRSQRIERTPDFKEIVWNQIFVIEKEPGTTNGVVQLWEQAAASGGGQWALMGEKPITLDEVPLVTMYAGDKEQEYVTRSIFMDLAYKQIEHWISTSDQRSILAAARFPMLASSGVQLDEDDESNFAIGPYKILFSPDAQGRWYYVEPKGSAIESGFKDLAAIELHMDMMALNPVQATHRQYVPQNERDIQETRVHSVVHDLALAAKDALEKGIRFMGVWGSKDYSLTSVDLNLDFSNTGDNLKEAAELRAAYKEGAISRETYLTEVRRRNLLGDDFDIVAEIALMAGMDQAETDLAAPEGKKVTLPKQEVDPAKDPAQAAPPVDFKNGQERPTRQI